MVPCSMQARAESRADMNNRRPADLPEFGAPPLTEAVLGVQFDVIPGFLAPHIGLVWQHFRKSFPLLEEQAPLPPLFETFGPNPQFMSGMLQLMPGPETPPNW